MQSTGVLQEGVIVGETISTKKYTHATIGGHYDEQASGFIDGKDSIRSQLGVIESCLWISAQDIIQTIYIVQENLEVSSMVSTY